MEKHIFNHPFDKVRTAIENMEEVDAVSAGLSPVTVRWLTKGNKYINIGLEEKTKATCALVKNNNSFEVKDAELDDAFEQMDKFVSEYKE